jgi:hypothetical protein
MMKNRFVALGLAAGLLMTSGAVSIQAQGPGGLGGHARGSVGRESGVVPGGPRGGMEDAQQPQSAFEWTCAPPGNCRIAKRRSAKTSKKVVALVRPGADSPR